MEPAKVSKGNEELVRLSTYFTKPNDNEGVRKILTPSLSLGFVK
jgi:hypothetical protein